MPTHKNRMTIGNHAIDDVEPCSDPSREQQAAASSKTGRFANERTAHGFDDRMTGGGRAATSERPQSGLMPAALNWRAQCSVSSRMNCLNCSGVILDSSIVLVWKTF